MKENWVWLPWGDLSHSKQVTLFGTHILCAEAHTKKLLPIGQHLLAAAVLLCGSRRSRRLSGPLSVVLKPPASPRADAAHEGFGSAGRSLVPCYHRHKLLWTCRNEQATPMETGNGKTPPGTSMDFTWLHYFLFFEPAGIPSFWSPTNAGLATSPTRTVL